MIAFRSCAAVFLSLYFASRMLIMCSFLFLLLCPMTIASSTSTLNHIKFTQTHPQSRSGVVGTASEAGTLGSNLCTMHMNYLINSPFLSTSAFAFQSCSQSDTDTVCGLPSVSSVSASTCWEASTELLYHDMSKSSLDLHSSHSQRHPDPQPETGRMVCTINDTAVQWHCSIYRTMNTTIITANTTSNSNANNVTLGNVKSEFQCLSLMTSEKLVWLNCSGSDHVIDKVHIHFNEISCSCMILCFSVSGAFVVIAPFM